MLYCLRVGLRMLGVVTGERHRRDIGTVVNLFICSSSLRVLENMSSAPTMAKIAELTAIDRTAALRGPLALAPIAGRAVLDRRL